MMDLQDNLFILDLVDFEEDEYRRSQGYLFWIFVINQAYHFLENAQLYKTKFKEEN